MRTVLIMGWLSVLFTSSVFGAIPQEVHSGEGLTKDQAAGLEKEISANPENATNRFQLLGYYFLKQGETDESAKAKHICWLIQKDPESELAGSPFAKLHAPHDAHYFDVERLWLEQVKQHPENIQILRNAVRFFFAYDNDEAERLLRLGLKIDPKDAWCLEKLDSIKDRLVYDLIDAGSMVTEARLKNTPSNEGIGRFYQLSNLARTAYKKGQMQEAIDFAGELLQTSAKYSKDWNYGNAVHDGNMIIGLAALKAGDRDRAADYLLRAGITKGSPQLNSFGPNMSLAKKLLEAGETTAVLEYFKLCRKFWKLGAQELDLWTKEVEYGKLPNFGVHLIH